MFIVVSYEPTLIKINFFVVIIYHNVMLCFNLTLKFEFLYYDEKKLQKVMTSFFSGNVFEGQIRTTKRLSVERICLQEIFDDFYTVKEML